MTARTCALCGHRNAVTVTQLDGRTFRICAHCNAPPPKFKRSPWTNARADRGSRSRPA